MRRAISSLGILVLGGMLTTARAADLICAITYQETAASRRAHPEKYNIFTATTDQKVEMTRGSLKTEIYGISVLDGKQRLLFSDAGPSLEISANSSNTSPMVAAGKAYVQGKERAWKGAPSPGVYSSPTAIYELSLDGSNKYRKVIEVKDELSSGKFFVNHAGTKLGYLSNENGKYSVSVYEIASGKLLHAWDASRLFKNHCPDCIEQGIGWISDDKLFITEELGDDDSISPQAHNVPGTYVVNEEGTDQGSIDSKLGHFLGASSDGSYIFAAARQKPAKMVLIRFNPHASAQKEVTLQAARFNYVFSKLSSSGTYLAFIEEVVTKSYQSEFHLSFKDLERDDERELFVLHPNPPQSADPNRSLILLGWLE